MPNPTPGDLHVNRILTNVSVAFLQDADQFVSDKLFPVVPVQKQSDRYRIYDRADFLRSDMQRRGPATESAGSGWRLSDDTYMADVWALHKDISDQDRANADDDIDLDRDSTRYLTQQYAMKRDLEWVASFFKTGVWTGADLDGVTGAPGAGQFKRWDVAGSTPIADLRKQHIAIRRLTGFPPNVLGMGPDVWVALVDHADFIDRIKYSERAIVGVDLLAAVLGIKRVVEIGAIRNSAAEGATASYNFIAGKHALLAYAADRPSIMAPSAGYTFVWTGLLGSARDGQRIKNFRIERLEADRVEIQTAFDHKPVATELGAFFEDAVS